MAAIGAVFTIGHVAGPLGEDENRVFEPLIDMFPEDGCQRACAGRYAARLTRHAGSKQRPFVIQAIDKDRDRAFTCR
ncbi:MAG: hypothetical protein AB7H90_22410 [Alphaproteobacteria bacterium]